MAQKQIDSFMQGYAMSMNDAMDPFILPRAKLWRQMKMGADLLEAQRKGEREKSLLLSQKLLRLSADLRSIAPQKPEGPLPAEALLAPSGPLSPAQRGVKDLEETPLPSACKPPLATSQMPSPQENGGGEEKVEEIEEIEEEKVEEQSPSDAALKSAMWRVVVRAALAKREGRDLRAELEAEKRAQEEKERLELQTTLDELAQVEVVEVPVVIEKRAERNIPVMIGLFVSGVFLVGIILLCRKKLRNRQKSLQRFRLKEKRFRHRFRQSLM
jgi:hypothetical protein